MHPDDELFPLLAIDAGQISVGTRYRGGSSSAVEAQHLRAE